MAVTDTSLKLNCSGGGVKGLAIKKPASIAARMMPANLRGKNSSSSRMTTIGWRTTAIVEPAIPPSTPTIYATTALVPGDVKGWSYCPATSSRKCHDQAEGLFIRLPNSPVPPDLVANHVVTSMLACIRWWLKNELPYPPEEMGTYATQLIMQPVQQMLLKKISLSSTQT